MRVFFKQVCSEPYRIFFPVGMLLAMMGAGHWGLYVYKLMPHSSAFFHSSLQTQGFMTAFVVGFLMTAMPRFASAKSASPGEVLGMLALILAHTVSLCLGQWVAAQFCFAGALVSLLVFAVKRAAKKSKGVMPPLEFVWIPAAILHGLAGSFLMIYHQLFKIPAPWVTAAKLLNEQGFILCIVIGVGGFLAPRLMGTFRVYAKPGQMPQDKALMAVRKRVLIFHLASIIVFFASFWIGAYDLNVSYFLRAFVITAEYFWTCSFIRFPRTPDFYAKLLWVSLWMVVIGSWSAVFMPQYRSGMLHILFIGGLSLMIFAVATMVVLSHGGAPEKLRQPLPVLWITGAGVFVSLGFRLGAAFSPENYFPLLGVSSIIWTGSALVWFVFALPKMGGVLSEEELERSHEEAKQRVAKLRDAEKSGHKNGECCNHREHSC